ncbi:MAG: helicase SNF2 [Methanosphaera stadtmanae]|nr:helicase SNF2 [Methanosphaera stadtmanae]
MKYGVTWWGNKWMNALKGVDFANRIPRGKTYANSNKVYDLYFEDNYVSAKISGKYNDYYDTGVLFRTFNENENNQILKIINSSEPILSSLLNHELPIELYEELTEENIQVFPKNAGDITPFCNCPDYAHICKHIAALIYVITHEVDKDPFNIFKLQGCDLLELLDYNSTSSNIKNIKDLFINENNEKVNETNPIDFTTIPNLMDLIFTLLNEKPLFYEKDFKTILKSVYASMSRFTVKNVDEYSRDLNNTYNPYIHLKKEKIKPFHGEDNELEDWLETTFLERWDKPNQWNNFSININNEYKINTIKTESEFSFTDENYEKCLFGFLTELSESNIAKFNRNIRVLYDIYQFTLELIKKHALIPEFFESDNIYYIRWIPAVFNNSVMEIINKLSVSCPDDLIMFENQKLSGKDQIITAVSLIVKGFLEKYLVYGATKTFKKTYENPIVKLFFFKGQKFDEISENNYENLINQWLSKFILNSRDYELFLVIDEEYAMFNVSVQVRVSNDEIVPVHDVIKETNDNDLKVQLISDTYLINEIFPQLHKSIEVNENLEFNLDDFSEFFINTLPLFEIIGINLILPKNLQKAFKPKLVLDIGGNKNEKGYLTFKDITKFNWKIAIGDKKYDIDEFKKLSVKSKGLVKLANDYIILDEEDTKSLIKQIDKLPEKLNRHELLKATLSGEVNGAEVNVDEELMEMVTKIKEKDKLEIPKELTADLRKYQITGFSWLVQNIKMGFGSILADDMGLGKTLQVLTTILHIKNEGFLKKNKVLIIAPTSLLTNWQEEIKKFTPTLTSYIYHGQNRIFPKEEYDIYLTSYGVIRRDEEIFKEKKWFLTVVDEAQNIKNPSTKQSRAIKAIKSKHRIALSGTPVENRLSEYWSIFDFINKGYLTTLKKFRKNYIIPIEKERSNDVLNNFKLITEPFILRRVKNDKNVIEDLPDKMTNDIYCNLSANQSSLYQEVLNSAIDEVEMNDGMKRKGLVLKLINSLKQICNHPSHFTKANKAKINDSGKMEVLINMLENILEYDEKVLIFTQYVKMGEIMKELIEERFNTEVLFLHGSLSRMQRDKLIDKFQNNSQNKIFILSLKAGGTGLNLTAATNVIHYDLWWNPAVENQATDRAYRIGQDENVMVYRFITKGTFEEQINNMLHEKEELANITIGTGEKFITEMNTSELRELLSLRMK